MQAITSFRQALELAREQAEILRLAGYRGTILPRRDEGRIELVALKPRAKHAIHLTFHPGGIAKERLAAASLAEARALIEA